MKPVTLRNRSGFTLIEIAVAVALLGLALGTLLSLHTGYLSAAIKDKNVTRAALYAKQLMTLIETAEGPPDPGTIQRDLYEILKDSGLVAEAEEAELERSLRGWEYNRAVQSIDLPEGEDVMRRIDIVITWGDSSDEQYSVVYFVRSELG